MDPLRNALAEIYYQVGEALLADDPTTVELLLASAAPLKKAYDEARTNYEVRLESFGEKKIAVIKEVRAHIKGLGLKEAKDLVEKAPYVIATVRDKETAERFMAALRDAGARATVRKAA